MTDFTPSPAQAAAIREIRDWFENRTPQQQVCRMFGGAVLKPVPDLADRRGLRRRRSDVGHAARPSMM